MGRAFGQAENQEPDLASSSWIVTTQLPIFGRHHPPPPPPPPPPPEEPPSLPEEKPDDELLGGSGRDEEIVDGSDEEKVDIRSPNWRELKFSPLYHTGS
jgi:hypothetical protein